MPIADIIAIILCTPTLAGTSIELAALAARTGNSDALADVAAWWTSQGGMVDSEILRTQHYAIRSLDLSLKNGAVRS
jgi:hypothetical protein